MATITITIPTADVPDVTDALCEHAGVPSSTINARDAVISFVRTITRAWRRKQASAALNAALTNAAEPDVV